MLQTYFNELADWLTGQLQPGEVFTCALGGEESDFIRMNKTLVRQATAVKQASVSLDLIEGDKHAAGSANLTMVLAEDRIRFATMLERLREARAVLPEDPYLLYNTEVQSSESVADNTLPDPQRALEAILAAGGERDLVGIYASGGIHSGFANSLGQRNWKTSYSFHLDWCFYHDRDKAVKSSYAGQAWDQVSFTDKVADADRKLAALGQRAQTIDPGHYRVYLAPAAVDDLIGILSWGAFGLKAQRTKNSSLLKMVEGKATLNPGVTVSENTADGIAPAFQGQGFVRPAKVTLIENGQLCGQLISPRSAKEYDVPTNGATGYEAPESLDMAAGDLAQEQILDALGTGIYIGNVWYLNYSDRNACRTTGMTRFATFWVENGAIVRPLNVMRFDETIYRMFGDQLQALTQEREFMISASTYGGRSTASARVPGALVDGFTFTL